MEAAWVACEEAGVECPEEVVTFFDTFDSSGDPREMPGVSIDLGDAVEEWHADMQDGHLVDVTKLPKDVRYILFRVSY